jgi:hypothetical protein
MEKYWPQEKEAVTAAQPIGCRYIYVLDFLIGNTCEPGMKSLQHNRSEQW